MAAAESSGMVWHMYATKWDGQQPSNLNITTVRILTVVGETKALQEAAGKLPIVTFHSLVMGSYP